MGEDNSSVFLHCANVTLVHVKNAGCTTAHIEMYFLTWKHYFEWFGEHKPGSIDKDTINKQKQILAIYIWKNFDLHKL